MYKKIALTGEPIPNSWHARAYGAKGSIFWSAATLATAYLAKPIFMVPATIFGASQLQTYFSQRRLKKQLNSFFWK